VRMHQTTVRFNADLWQQLEREAARIGVSAAQYVRDATFARLAYAAGQRGEPLFGMGPAFDPRPSGADLDAGDAQAGSRAVWAQARQARERARTVRSEARAMQAETSQGRAGRATRGARQG
jgi:hypothetical protein